MTNIKFWLVVIFCYLFSTSAASQNSVQQLPTPNWVDEISYVQDSLTTSPYSYLLVDFQENAISEEYYTHFVIQLDNTDGVQEMSSISIDYDPSFQRIKFHDITIYRDGKKINKPIRDFKFLQRETDMSRAIYDGTISVIKNLTDIRSGDIVEYSYTIQGFNPIFGTDRFTRFNLNFGVYINKLYSTYLIDKDINLKYNVDAVEADISKNNGITKYKWELFDIEPNFIDYSVPSWYQQRNSVTMSTMNSWKDVVGWGQSLYTFSSKDKSLFRSNIKEELSLNGNEKDILDAIRFVQDDIRYLGFEDGIKAYKPHDPNTVLNRRFGDCKDKSFLLSTILSEMGIDASPMYVHTSQGKLLGSKLPAPNKFDHCIVTFNFRDNRYFVDPTITSEGGDLENLSIPDYGLGLPIKKGSEGLIKVENKDIPLIIMNESLRLDTIGGGAQYTVSTKNTGSFANGMRSYFNSNSDSKIKNDYEAYYTNAYLDTKIEYLDIVDTTRESSNEITVLERYKIENIWETQSDYLTLNIYSFPIENYLNIASHKKDALPMQIGKPKEFIQTVDVYLPDTWSIEDEENTISNRNFDYSFSAKFRGKKLQLKHRYYLKDGEVSVDQVERVEADIKEILKGITYELSYSKALMGGQGSDIAWQSILVSFLGLILGFVFIFLVETKFDPQPMVPNENLSIGGWLVLPTIGLILSPLVMIGDLIMLQTEGSYSTLTWNSIIMESQFDSVVILCITGMINIFLLIINVYLIVLFFKRRSSIPVLMMVYYLFLLFIMFSDSYVGYLYDPNDSILNKDVIRALTACIIWIPYFYFSRRVKDTFVIRRKLI